METSNVTLPGEDVAPSNPKTPRNRDDTSETTWVIYSFWACRSCWSSVACCFPRGKTTEPEHFMGKTMVSRHVPLRDFPSNPVTISWTSPHLQGFWHGKRAWSILLLCEMASEFDLGRDWRPRDQVDIHGLKLEVTIHSTPGIWQVGLFDIPFA